MSEDSTETSQQPEFTPQGRMAIECFKTGTAVLSIAAVILIGGAPFVEGWTIMGGVRPVAFAFAVFLTANVFSYIVMTVVRAVVLELREAVS